MGQVFRPKRRSDLPPLEKKFYGEISENLLEVTSLPLKYWPEKYPSFDLVECLAEIPRTSRALIPISAVKQCLELVGLFWLEFSMIKPRRQEVEGEEVKRWSAALLRSAWEPAKDSTELSPNKSNSSSFLSAL